MSFDRFHYITIATKPHPVLQHLQKKVESNGETITVLGMQEQRAIGWENHQRFGVKLREVYEFLKRPDLLPNDIVMFTDAYDVIYCGDKEEIIRRYFTFNKPIVFGCETECNPDPARESEYAFRNAEFPFLNSGMFIGRVWALRQCMEGYVYDDYHDDQRFWTTQFFEHPDLIELDYRNLLFLNTHGIESRFFNYKSGVVFYKSANPMFFHVNGPDKQILDKYIS
jgi:hypothetical protein